MTHCKKCGRKLTDPRSIKRQCGPICWKKLEVHDIQVEVLEKKEVKEDYNFFNDLVKGLDLYFQELKKEEE